MPKSTDKKFTLILDTEEHPNLTKDATALAKKKGHYSLGAYIRVLLIAELDKESKAYPPDKP